MTDCIYSLSFVLFLDVQTDVQISNIGRGSENWKFESWNKGPRGVSSTATYRQSDFVLPADVPLIGGVRFSKGQWPPRWIEVQEVVRTGVHRLPVLTGYLIVFIKEHLMFGHIYGNSWWLCGKKEQFQGCGVGQVIFSFRREIHEHKPMSTYQSS